MATLFAVWTYGDNAEACRLHSDRLAGAKGDASMSVSERLRAIVAQTFQVPIEQIDDDTTPAVLPAWDSLGQMDLIMALEREFSIEFGLEDIMLMNSVGEIRSLLEKRNVGEN